MHHLCSGCCFKLKKQKIQGKLRCSCLVPCTALVTSGTMRCCRRQLQRGHQSQRLCPLGKTTCQQQHGSKMKVFQHSFWVRCHRVCLNMPCSHWQPFPCPPVLHISDPCIGVGFKKRIYLEPFPSHPPRSILRELRGVGSPFARSWLNKEFTRTSMYRIRFSENLPYLVFFVWSSWHLMVGLFMRRWCGLP